MNDGEAKAWRELLQVVGQTREAIEYLAKLAQNGKDETRVFDRDWTAANEIICTLCRQVELREPELIRESDAPGEGS